MKMVVIFMITFIYTVSSLAQSFAKRHPALSIESKDTQKKILPLSIGDQVPDITFENVINYKSKKAKLSDFKGKLVILDMWSTNCISCIAGFPNMERLQNKFGNKIQILLVNPHTTKYDTEFKIKAVLEGLKKRTGFYPILPIPIQDSILNAYFPHRSVPHQVWIDGTQKVVAITNSVEVTEENINSILEGKIFNFRVKNDWAYDTRQPLLVNGNGGADSDFIYRSLFTKYKGDVGFESGIRGNENNELIGYFILNAPLRILINTAYSDLMSGINANRIILNVKNNSQYKAEFNPEFAYCYDLTLQPTPADLFDFKRYLKEDLKRFFNVQVYLEKRKMKCLKLLATDSIAKSFTKFDKTSIDIEATSIRKYIHNYPIEGIVRLLSNCTELFIDETGFSRNLDIDFPDNFDLSDCKGIIQVLINAGFRIIEEEKELEVVIISDKITE